MKIISSFFIVYVIVKCQKIDLFAIYKILLQDLPTQGQTTNGQKRDKRYTNKGLKDTVSERATNGQNII